MYFVSHFFLQSHSIQFRREADKLITWRCAFAIYVLASGRELRVISALSRYFYGSQYGSDVFFHFSWLFSFYMSEYIMLSVWQPEFNIMQHCCVAMIQHERYSYIEFKPTFPFSILFQSHDICAITLFSDFFFLFHIKCLDFSTLFQFISYVLCAQTDINVLFNHKIWHIIAFHFRNLSNTNDFSITMNFPILKKKQPQHVHGCTTYTET